MKGRKEIIVTKARQIEMRFLNDSEKRLVEASHHPEVCDLSNEELADLRRNLRTRRTRARDIASRQRREIRGKAAPRGEKSTADDAGSREKLSVLSAALQRVNSETSRRERYTARQELKQNAERALELRRAASRPKRPKSKRPKDGMHPIPNERRPDLVNRMEVGRVSQFVKDSQARRDNRGS
jgi:hypothetical protein